MVILALAGTLLLSVMAYRFSKPVPSVSEKPLSAPIWETFARISPATPLPNQNVPVPDVPDLQVTQSTEPVIILPPSWDLLQWEPYYRNQLTVPDMSFDIQSDSMYQRDASSAVRTLSPVTLNVYQPLDVGYWQTFRPTVSAGVGVLSQSMDSHEYQDTQREVRALLHFGIGAEWMPTDRVLFRLGYDYFRLPVSSSLNPNMPERDHAISLGLEIKF